MTDFPDPVRVPLPGRAGDPDFALSVHACGEGPAVVFCHGFPDLARTWRAQLPAVAAAGFQALAPDMRGYGASSRPEAVEEYGLTELTGGPFSSGTTGAGSWCGRWRCCIPNAWRA